MTFQKRWAGIALISAAVMTGPAMGQPTLAQSSIDGRAAPIIRRDIAVRTSPVKAVPDADDSDDADVGLEAREAMGEAAPDARSPPVMSGTLNAQYALLRTSAPAPSVSAETPMQPAVQAGPTVALARRVVESATAFADYMQRASAVRPDYADGAGVSRALQRGGVYEASQLQEGAIAYVALAALQDQAFVQGISDLAQDQAGAPMLAERLASDPRRVMQAPGASGAAARAAAALGRLGLSLYDSGAAVKRSAYDIQHSAWSRLAIAEPETRLAAIKAGSAIREPLSADSGRAMVTSLVELRQAQIGGGSGRLTPSVARGMTLAALAVLGEAGEEHVDRVTALLSEASNAQCLKMARLNLYQCLSVAGPNYEDVFCLGQHAMMETARCVADASGWTPAPIAEPTAPVAQPAVSAASILVPIAFTPREATAASALLPTQETPESAGSAMQLAAAGEG